MHQNQRSLFDPTAERGACGLGFVARVDGQQTREIVESGLIILHNLAHRGAVGADADTGDGAGMMLQIPDAFFRRQRLGFTLPPAGHYAVGVLFLPPDDRARAQCERTLERIAAEEGQPVLGWREVPVEPARIGLLARSVMPVIRQVFIARKSRSLSAFTRALYVIRRRLHWAVQATMADEDEMPYVVSLSATTLVYKGLLQGTQLDVFYPDLRDPYVASAMAVVHSRFSTNTLGSWERAHPYRYIAHNGEINTLRGNINWMRAREQELQFALFPAHHAELGPIVQPGGSDTAAFDNALEFLLLAGRSVPHAVMTMVPEAWENDPTMPADRRAFYQYTGALMAPWDGPAAIVFCDGRTVGAALDRNGLRPARYSITNDGLVVLASEEGVLPLPPEDVVRRWRLGPGNMLVVDTVRRRILEDGEIKRSIVRRKPYRRWVREGMTTLDRLPRPVGDPPTEPSPLVARQRAFGYTREELSMVLGPMAANGKEPDGSMGTDTPLAVLSNRPQLLFSYFHQLFAQVSNPPIDPLRESMVMSLAMSLGPEVNLIEERPEHCNRIRVTEPVLDEDGMHRLRELQLPPFHTATISLLFPVAAGESGMAAALERLCRRAEDEIAAGASILILSDRGVDPAHAAIPSLLATAAVHHHLVRLHQRTRVGLVVESADAREVHHIALLIAFGAAAVCPYLALETAGSLADSGDLPGLDRTAARSGYRQAVHLGLRKIIAKMGISTLVAYCGAQVCEAVGLDRDLVDRYFTGTASRLGGVGLGALARDVLTRHAEAFTAEELAVGGEYHLRRDGEYHQWNAESIVALQRATRTGSYATFKEFTAHFDREAGRLATLRGLFDLVPHPIPLAEVEPAASIVRRFSTGAMSFGSLSKEAHETLAIAMNRIGAKSNTGEGGEEPERFVPDENGDSRRSAIKQVASARFGVTTEYLVQADVIQIKMAQGAKPGEGGQLPGGKVSGDIARARHSTPGVGLISPPPHHDIYSIEDLAQLIHDLKMVNPAADISVKLVAEVGVGTIAAGVAKARADHITIAGYDGGTGASPLSSIKHAGLPWELGLAETQQVLVANGLRDRVTIQADGQLKTGRDVVIAALLGAEEFAFSTAPLVATGCIMMRACHLNTCPVGIATQDPVLRARFAGKPEHVINYCFFVAEEVREYMALLGFRTVDEMVGRVDRLRIDRASAHPRAQTLDLTPLVAPAAPDGPRHRTRAQDHGLDSVLDRELLRLAAPSLERRQPVTLDLSIANTDRTVGAMLSGEIVRQWGAEGLPDSTIDITLRGTAGQSFGAWLAPGVTLRLEGESNDYTGKGLAGGRIVVASPPGASYLPERSIVTGNVALYGATGGETYFRGYAGERFAVRNSGAHAVVEGVGDHGCEYMTGGCVVVLGPTGRNFAAGMSGGLAFVLDLWGRFAAACNQDMVGLEPLADREHIALVRRLLQRHVRWTGSDLARRVLAHWTEYLPRFVTVIPHDLKRVLAAEEQQREARERAG